MIEIPRSVLRQLRLALKRSFPPRCRPERKLWVVIEAEDKLTLHAQHADASVSLQLPTHHAPELLALPASALDEVQGREGMVMLERHDEKVVARWDETDIPRVIQFDTTDPAKLPPFPSPTSFGVNPPQLLKALHTAMHCAAVDSVRYATCKVQLRGSGEIVATDGKQLLMHGGWKFPWKDNVLVPRMSLFGAAGLLPQDVPVKVGRSSKHVVIQAGEWTVALTADTESRFPKVEEVIPKGSQTTWTLSPADATAVLQALPKLPGAKDDDAPVTVDLTGKVVVRARSGQSKPVEFHLEQSKVNGPPIKFSTNRHLLGRALQLGFHEVGVVNADTPLLCREPSRLFVWMPLPKESCIAAHPEAIVIRGSDRKPPSTVNHERMRPVPRQRANAKPVRPPTAEQAAKPNGLGSLIDEARELTAAMRGMFSRSKSLLTSLQLHRRKARIVDSTLASLKKLQGKVQ